MVPSIVTGRWALCRGGEYAFADVVVLWTDPAMECTGEAGLCGYGCCLEPVAERGSRCVGSAPCNGTLGRVFFFLCDFLRPVPAPTASLCTEHREFALRPATAPMISLEETGTALFFLGLFLLTVSVVTWARISASRLVSPGKSRTNSTREAVHSPLSFNLHSILSIITMDPLNRIG